MQVALYARASSDEQALKDLSIPAQFKALRQWAHKEGWTVAAEFVDEGVSGRTDKRPEFQRLITLAKQKPCPF